jgi:hypothetical protein
MARWGLLPTQWDELGRYDRAFMMEFVRTEADIQAVSQERAGKGATFIVALSEGDDG